MQWRSPLNAYSVSAVAIAPSTKINPLLASYLQSLATRPIYTKSVTAAVLSFVSETIAGYASGSPPTLAKKDRSGIPPIDLLKTHKKAFMLAAYGFFLSAPLGHTLLSILQKAFAGRTSARAKVAMIVASNLFVSPIQQTVYIAAMAVVNGATTVDQVVKTWKMGFWPLMKLTWVISTLSMATAQKFVPPELWVPLFNLIGATVGTYVNIQTKKKALVLRAKAEAKREADAKDIEKKE